MLGCDELHEWRREDEAYAGLVITDCDEFVNYSNNLTDAVVDDYNGETKYYSGSFLIEENINPQGSVYPNTEFVACNSIKLGNGFKASCDYYNNIKFQVHDNLKGGKSSTIIQHTNLNNNLSLNNSIDIEEIKQPFAYKIYPNPANSSITIQLDGLEYFPGNIVISDINGKIVKKEIINQAESMIDISTFPSGLYFAKFIQEDRIVTKKFSKL